MGCASTIDWAGTGTMLQGIGTVIGALAVISAAIIGSRTFNNWKRQKLTERHIEQAERILTTTYRIRRDLAMVRNPILWAHELNAAEEQLKASNEWIWQGVDDRERLTTARAYHNRINSTREDQRALEECQPMARAFFGEELEKAIEKLNNQFWDVQVYVDANRRDATRADAEHRRKIQSTIYSGWPSAEENEIDQIIAAQVKLIERICAPVLRMENVKVK